MAASRCRSAGPAAHSVGELARRCGGITHRRAKGLLAQLTEAGLVSWSSSSDRIEFPAVEGDGPTDTISRGGRIMLPRRMAVWLTRTRASRSVLAVALASAMRLISRRAGGFNGTGRLAISWVARHCHVSQRQAKQARRTLIDVGWITPAPERGSAAHERRFGRVFKVDFNWLAPGRCSRSAPIRPPECARSAPALTDQDLPYGNEKKNQESMPGARTGSWLDDRGEGIKPSPAMVSTPAPLPTPRLEDVRAEDLGEDVGRTLELHRLAVSKGLSSDSEAGRLAFVAAAVRARKIGTNPPALLAETIRRGWWNRATQAHEDEARLCLKLHQAKKDGRPPQPAAAKPPAGDRPSPMPRHLVAMPRPSIAAPRPPAGRRSTFVPDPVSSPGPVGLSGLASIMARFPAAISRPGPP
jgi:hypothetical protein